MSYSSKLFLSIRILIKEYEIVKYLEVHHLVSSESQHTHCGYIFFNISNCFHVIMSNPAFLPSYHTVMRSVCFRQQLFTHTLNFISFISVIILIFPCHGCCTESNDLLRSTGQVITLSSCRPPQICAHTR